MSQEAATHILFGMADAQESRVITDREDYHRIIKFLLAHGAKINQRTYLGHTPLTLAAWQCNIEMCRELIDSGADVNAELENGLTASGRAGWSGSDWNPSS